VRTLQAFERAKLPAGRTKISFLFDGPEIQRSAQQEWRLWAGLRCARSEGNLPDLTFVLIPPQQIRLNPEEYESRSSIVVHVNSMRLVQGGVGRTTVSVPQGSANDVQFSLGELPKGIDAQLRIPEGDSKLASRQLLIETAAHIAPGRYFIPITAVTGDEKTTTQCVLDIDPY
jgi:hypothetical protein